MSSKMMGSICGIIAIVSCGICSICYAVVNSTSPWWLIVLAGGILCAIISQIGAYTREENKEKKHKKMIGCICSSISMISVFIFLLLLMLTKFNNSWIVIMIGGIISCIIYMLDNAIKEDKKGEKK